MRIRLWYVELYGIFVLEKYQIAPNLSRCMTDMIRSLHSLTIAFLPLDCTTGWDPVTGRGTPHFSQMLN